MSTHSRIALLMLALMASLGGCSSKALYTSGQAMQRNECAKIQDAVERGECLDRAAKSQQEYEAIQKEDAERQSPDAR